MRQIRRLIDGVELLGRARQRRGGIAHRSCRRRSALRDGVGESLRDAGRTECGNLPFVPLDHQLAPAFHRGPGAVGDDSHAV